ncbi:polyprenol monophosphomannose synthase [Haloplanus halophilus]|uniref:polyprenol monophosphomannose synthase n=1 Tax=Haloplanus halophilus TaxID=2949993 RepID=UPI00203B367A|nr:polyprenol monophosphomannose synthase [Haloplanus sp. GDY1]
MTRSVSVVLPTFEEHQTIGGVIEAAREAVADRDYEIVVVDDSETRRTVDALVDRYGTAQTRVRWIRRHDETGLASAVLEGFEIGLGDRYVVLDADGQHPPRRIRNLLYRLDDGADLAVCSRHVDGGEVAGDWPTHRRVISMGAETLAQLAVPTARKLSDPMSGYFAVEADVVDPVRERLRPHGYKILLELVARCPISRIDEVPYTFAEREEGVSGLGPREYLKYVKHLIQLTIPARRESVQVVSPEVEHVDG